MTAVNFDQFKAGIAGATNNRPAVHADGWPAGRLA
jgi:hypothetical protein